MHITHQHLVKRQAPPDIPNVSGLGTAVTAAFDNGATPTGSLLLGGSAAPGAPPVSVAFVPGQSAVTVTQSASATPTSSVPSPSVSPGSTSDTAVSSSHGSSFSTGAVIGVCVGAFAVLAIVLLGVYWYLKHSAPRTREIRSRGGPEAPSSAARNATGEDDRRRSRLEPWNKLGDDEDHWEGKSKPRAKDTQKSAENEKFAMFEKEPSLRSTEEKATTDGHNFDPSTMPDFSKYTPDLAEEFAQAPARPFVPRANGSPVVSWDGETVGDDSFLSMRSVRRSTDGMSPTSVMAKQTPLAQTSQLHRWESAEVLTMNIEDQPTAPPPVSDKPSPAENPFADEVDNTQSFGNPFFNAQAITKRNPFSDTHSIHKTTRSRKSSVATVSTIQAADSGLRRADSTASDASTVRGNHQAMESLIAALDIAPLDENGHDRLHRSSMQTSDSMFMTAENQSITSVPATPKAV